MNTDLSVVPPAEVKSRPIEADPPTGRALWPTFMRRTLTEEALEAAAARPRPTVR